MVTLSDAGQYIMTQLPDNRQKTLLDRFFRNFMAGGFVTLGPDDRVLGSREFVRRRGFQLSHIFLYYLKEPKKRRMETAFSCFDGMRPQLPDYAIFTNQVMSYKMLTHEADGSGDFQVDEAIERHLLIDGALLIGGMGDVTADNVTYCHVTRTYLPPVDSRRLLYAGVDLAFRVGFD